LLLKLSQVPLPDRSMTAGINRAHLQWPEIGADGSRNHRHASRRPRIDIPARRGI